MENKIPTASENNLLDLEVVALEFIKNKFPALYKFLIENTNKKTVRIDKSRMQFFIEKIENKQIIYSFTIIFENYYFSDSYCSYFKSDDCINPIVYSKCNNTQEFETASLSLINGK